MTLLYVNRNVYHNDIIISLWLRVTTELVFDFITFLGIFIYYGLASYVGSIYSRNIQGRQCSPNGSDCTHESRASIIRGSEKYKELNCQAIFLE